MNNMKSKASIFGVALFLTFFVIQELDARPRGGGGKSFSRGGIASGGSFSTQARQRPTRQARPKQRNTNVQRNVQRNVNAGNVQRNVRNNKNAKDLQKNRQDWKDKSREDRQDWRDKNREDRQDFIDDQARYNRHNHHHWDSHHYYYDDDWDNAGAFVAGVVVGGAVVAAASTPQVTYVSTLPCTVHPVWLNNTYFYKCGTQWYQRGFTGGTVRYVLVSAPPGH